MRELRFSPTTSWFMCAAGSRCESEYCLQLFSPRLAQARTQTTSLRWKGIDPDFCK